MLGVIQGLALGQVLQRQAEVPTPDGFAGERLRQRTLVVAGTRQ